ncbi:MAG: 2Fe-2S iron-sulfur cluster binding domain-containing protein [Proteobacteria bacterium]|nr:2Fe-2S iron-sulfur cluster binding domain-containing protein [Pseudomonadota bacterium]
MIYFKESETKIETNIEGKTVLEIAEREGIKIRNICRKGLCGMCKVRLISGEVSMDLPFALNDYEKKRGVILSCLAFAKSDVVIEK